MLAAFYIASAIALLATGVALTRSHAVHALLYLIVSLLAVAVDFFVLGAAFVAALEVIVYAGAIMVLFLFVLMLLGVDRAAVQQERAWMSAAQWGGAALLAALLLGELAYLVAVGSWPPPASGALEIEAVASGAMGPYLLGVELASMLLLSGLVGAYHIGKPDEASERMASEDAPATETRPAAHREAA